MNKYYQVTKPGLSTNGLVGKYVAHYDGDYIILRFVDGKEARYLKTSVTLMTDPVKKKEYWIVVKESSKGGNPAQFKHHESEEEARNEAIRLAQENPGHGFRYYKQCARIEYKPVTTYELQETK